MRPAVLLLATSLATAAAAAARTPLGLFGHWAAYRDAPAICVARTAALSGKGGLAVTSSPRAGVRVQVHVDLPLAARAGSVRLASGGRGFALTGRGRDAWPIDARADLAMVTALRAGGVAELRGVDEAGHRFRALYPLAGAPSAIDAALIGCAR